jgi:hypothetical protein
MNDINYLEIRHLNAISIIILGMLLHLGTATVGDEEKVEKSKRTLLLMQVSSPVI